MHVSACLHVARPQFTRVHTKFSSRAVHCGERECEEYLNIGKKYYGAVSINRLTKKVFLSNFCKSIFSIFSLTRSTIKFGLFCGKTNI